MPPPIKDFDSFNPTPEMIEKGRQLGAWYRAALSRAGTNSYQLSKRINVSQSYLSDIERDCWHGKAEPRTFKKVEAYVIKKIGEELLANVDDGLKAFGYDPSPALAVPQVIQELNEDSKHHLARLLESLGTVPLSAAEVVIPILARVSAGKDLFSPGNLRGTLRIPAELAQKYDAETCFAVKVFGDCLEGLHIIDGDMLVCRLAQVARDGDVVVVAGDEDEALAKRFRQEDQYRWLETVPGKGEPEIVELKGKPRIVGIKIGLVRVG